MSKGGRQLNQQQLDEIKKVCRRYTPDFVIKEGESRRLVEIHGWLDERTENKLIEFCELYPEENFELLGPGEMARLGLIEAWYENHHVAAKVSDLGSRLKSRRLSHLGFRLEYKWQPLQLQI